MASKKCERCDYIGASESHLRIHRFGEHMQVELDRNVFCDQCSFKTYSGSLLKRHMERIHDKVKKYSCKSCDQRFTNQCALTRHRQSVHLMIMFECDQCDYKAKEKASVKTHKKAIHKGIKFPSKYCDYKGSFKENLTRHISTVHGSVEYSCTDCSYSTKNRQSLNKHRESIHLQIKYKCNICEFQAQYQ